MNKLLLLLFFPLFTMSASAQYDYTTESYRVTYKGNAPTISDFVTALLSNEDLGEALGLFRSYWQIYNRVHQLPPAVQMNVDTPHGFVSFSFHYAEDNSDLSVQTCYWNCKDGRHKLVAQVIASFQNGRPMMGQYDGIMFYTYDSVTKRMKWTPTMDVCDEAFTERGIVDGTVINLPSVGKDISVWFPEPGGDKHYLLKWTGSGFRFVAD